MKIDFTGKTVLVTGASGGIGRAISLAFSRTNATIHAHYKSNKKEAEKTLQLLSGDNHSLHQADLSDHKDVEAMINNIGNINTSHGNNNNNNTNNNTTNNNIIITNIINNTNNTNTNNTN